MYYQNLAGDALIKENYDLAFSHLMQALSLSNLNPDTLNTLAVLYKMSGDIGQAEKIYQYAIENTDGSVNILRNDVILLEEQNRMREAQKVASMFDSVDDDDTIHSMK